MRHSNKECNNDTDHCKVPTCDGCAWCCPDHCGDCSCPIDIKLIDPSACDCWCHEEDDED